LFHDKKWTRHNQNVIDERISSSDMKPPQSRKDVQKLIGTIAALSRFMLKLVEWSLPFFKVLRGSNNFEWGPEKHKAFDNLKAYIQQLPTLSKPKSGQPLILYVSASHTAVSRALVQEKKTLQNNKKTIRQVPVCFVSKAMVDSKRYYSEMEIICYVVVMSARKLRHYIEAHKV
jgi:hypothetical protein